MSKPKILLLGAGGHAKSCIDVIEQAGHYEIYGLVGLETEVGEKICGYPILEDDAGLANLVDTVDYAIVAVGQIESPKLRMKLFRKLTEYSLKLATVISPSAYVSPHASVGSGTIVMHGAVINADARVGKNCIVNSRALVEHDVIIEDHCHVATGAVLNGACHIGTASFVGSCAVIREGIELEAYSLIGMGQLVRHDHIDVIQRPGKEK